MFILRDKDLEYTAYEKDQQKKKARKEASVKDIQCTKK